MCLYQIKLRNPHYLANEKNNGIIPKPEDQRHLYINTNCGWCEECRKEIANEWRIRLQEEWHDNRRVQFVTLSYSPEAIEKLSKDIVRKHYKGLGEGEIDVNILAAYSIRMWGERWRKKYKKAPRKWLITELGHKGSERLHLHGMLWNEEGVSDEDTIKAIDETWQYGNTFCGDYVSERTFNYITKYITKIDGFHKGYKQKIFTSKKMGAGYLERKGRRLHEFRFEKTITWYTNHQNLKFKLPKYYKNKLWTENERKWLWTYALNQKKQRIMGVEYDLKKISVYDFEKALKGARKTNKRAGFGDNFTVNKKYIITPLMTMKYNDILNFDKDKLVKSSERRLVEKINYYAEKNKVVYFGDGKMSVHFRNEEDFDKSIDVDKLVLGSYVGNLTDAERKYNYELEQARKEHLTVRQWRLKQKGYKY